jgi:hypothetical protein
MDLNGEKEMNSRAAKTLCLSARRFIEIAILPQCGISDANECVRSIKLN